ncbi:MarR family winged helix-turn-helix transcriptional regulator [Brucepastera parasyntrophica]|uniref:MarR family winged helix-turn-helix transcriptional regulator n=1 Tax=Brucepastera parasyntrophica TaxID=2880008 RepID=UPI0021097E34|nr:MarR family winged helix-turn-helix transcriptional regulator [Brucepastera parasyntrophica]ULQ58940.1 MarR family winged helix-turn-helix transcriptional regulator [Brucepastera parasyntrophica]
MSQSKTVVFAIKAVSNHIKRIFSKYPFTDNIEEITCMHYAVIHFIYNNRDKKIFQKDIESEYNIRGSTATGILKLMEQNGFIRRIPALQDARLKKIVLTNKALGIYCQAKSTMDEINEKILTGIPEDEVDSFFLTIEKILHNLQEFQ